MAPGAVEIAVTDNGVDFFDAGQPFTFLPMTTVTAISPSSGPFAGAGGEGRLSTILTGTGFSALDKPSCSFDGKIVAAEEVISATEVRCTAPVMTRSATAWSTPKSVPVRFSNNGVDFDDCGEDPESGSRAKAMFLFYNEPVVASLTPSRGVTNGGESTVIVTGSNLVKHGGTAVEEDDRVLLCRLEQDGNNVTAIGIVLGATEARCRVSCGDLSGLVSFEVSLNGGAHWTAADVAFRCDPLAVVSSVVPEFGPTSGGTTLTVKGSNFSPIESLSCVFGGGGSVNGSTVLMPVLWKSRSVVECTTLASGSAGPIRGEIAVSNDGIHFSSPIAGASFEYVSPPIVTRVTPSFAPVAGIRSSGDVSVVATGANFVNTSLSSCHFTPFAANESGIFTGDSGFELGSSVAVAATFLSSTEVSCLVPRRALPVGPTLLTVSVNGVDFDGKHGATIELEALPQVSKVVPARGMAGAIATPVEVGGDRHRNGFNFYPMLGLLESIGTSVCAVTLAITCFASSRWTRNYITKRESA